MQVLRVVLLALAAGAFVATGRRGGGCKRMKEACVMPLAGQADGVNFERQPPCSI